MLTVTWAHVDSFRQAAVAEAAEAELGSHGFSCGSLHVIAPCRGCQGQPLSAGRRQAGRTDDARSAYP